MRRPSTPSAPASHWTATLSTTTADSAHRSELTRPGVAWRLAAARAVLAWERAFPALWTPFLLAAGFAALAMLGFPAWLGAISGGWAHLAFLIASVTVFLWSLRRAAVAWSPAGEDEAVRRLERDSGFEHRPVSGLNDRLAAGEADTLSRALWQVHRHRLAAQLDRLRVGPPEPILARIDRYGVRALVLLPLLVGLVTAPNPWARLTAAFQPALSPLIETAVPTLDVWINPPAYTGRVPILLAQGATPDSLNQKRPTEAEAARTGVSGITPRHLAVPTGSRLIAKVNGGIGTPSMVIASEGLETAVPFEAVGVQAYQIEQPIASGTALAIRQDDADLVAWTLSVLPDLKPTVSLLEEPQPTERAALMMYYSASDDYGLAEVEAHMYRLSETREVTDDTPIMLSLSLPGRGLEAIEAKDFHDLTPHPWAGQLVRLTLVARDEAGQEGRSEPVTLLLPERRFNHPVARAVIEQRKRLTTEPESKDDIAQILAALAARPQHYYDDLVTFLALRTAAGRLTLSNGEAGTIDAVQALLWDTALRIEDGELSLAARELRELERKIMEMLAEEDIDEQALEQLLNELKQKIDEYLQAMMEQMQQALEDGGESQEMAEIDPNRLMERQDLMDMVDRARELMKSGAKAAAQQLLSQLREMMENLRAGRPQPLSPEQMAAREMMRQLQELAEQQQRLMDDTYKSHQNGFRRQGQQDQQLGQMPNQNRQGQPQPGQGLRRPGEPGQRGQPGMPGDGEDGMGAVTAEDLARLQENLRRQLGEFMRKLGEGMGSIPQPFGEAERAMNEAREALGQGQPGEAVGPQGDAIEQLQDGAQALSEAMRQQQQAAGGATADPNAQGQANGQDRPDPLRDRPGIGGTASDTGTGLPEESDLLRARRIFDELRRRSGDRGRPSLELDYIERLMKRF